MHAPPRDCDMMPLSISPAESQQTLRQSDQAHMCARHTAHVLTITTCRNTRVETVKEARSAPVDSKIQPVVIVAAAAFAVGVDVHGYGTASAEAAAIAEVFVVLLDQDRIVQEAAVLPVLDAICSGSSLAALAHHSRRQV